MISAPNRSLWANLVDLAALVRALVGPLHGISLLHQDHNGCFAMGGAGDLSVGRYGCRPKHRGRPAGESAVAYQRRRRRAESPDPSTARPAEVMITDGEG